jgi:hypothetical protein
MLTTALAWKTGQLPETIICRFSGLRIALVHDVIRIMKTAHTPTPDCLVNTIENQFIAPCPKRIKNPDTAVPGF